MRIKNCITPVITCAVMFGISFVPAMGQQTRQLGTRFGTLEFESNGFPTKQTVDRVREEIDYQRAVQAYIHWLPAVHIMQWRNAHEKLGGKPGDLIA